MIDMASLAVDKPLMRAYLKILRAFSILRPKSGRVVWQKLTEYEKVILAEDLKTSGDFDTPPTKPLDVLAILGVLDDVGRSDYLKTENGEILEDYLEAQLEETE